MFRLLTILSVLAALTMSVSAAPAASASGTGVGRVGGKMHYDDISLGVITDKKLPKLLDDTETGWWQRGR
jgi:hypothetical protein